jgi:hypothetical protein
MELLRRRRVLCRLALAEIAISLLALGDNFIRDILDHAEKLL